MARAKLTKEFVDSLGTQGKALMVYDTELAGFAVRVSPSGVKTWQVEYRPAPGGRKVNKRRMSIGKTSLIPAAEARKSARDILYAASKGGDPVRDRGLKRNELTISELVDLYDENGCYVLRGVRQGEPFKPEVKTMVMANLRNHFVPLLGTKRVSEVETYHLEQMVRDIAEGKTQKDVKLSKQRRSIVQGGEGAARKVFRNVSAVFTFAVRRKIIAANPCLTAAVRKVDNRRTQFLSFEQVAALGRALETLQSQGANPMAINIARLWALTGCRRNEIAGLKWSEVDFANSCLRLGDTKTGNSVRPLAPAALALLKALPHYEGSPYVFPATRGTGHYVGTTEVWNKARELAGIPWVTPHILRHTLGSTAVSSGETIEMTGAILGHNNRKSTEIYGHVQQEPANQAASRAVSRIADALSGKLPKGGW